MSVLSIMTMVPKWVTAACIVAIPAFASSNCHVPRSCPRTPCGDVHHESTTRIAAARTQHHRCSGRVPVDLTPFDMVATNLLETRPSSRFRHARQLQHCKDSKQQAKKVSGLLRARLEFKLPPSCELSPGQYQPELNLLIAGRHFRRN
jgi:hypothetical protein